MSRKHGVVRYGKADDTRTCSRGRCTESAAADASVKRGQSLGGTVTHSGGYADPKHGLGVTGAPLQPDAATKPVAQLQNTTPRHELATHQCVSTVTSV